MREVRGSSFLKSTWVIGCKLIINVEPEVNLLVCKFAYCFLSYVTSIVWLWAIYSDKFSLPVDNDGAVGTDKGVEKANAHLTTGYNRCIGQWDGDYCICSESETGLLF